VSATSVPSCGPETDGQGIYGEGLGALLLPSEPPIHDRICHFAKYITIRHDDQNGEVRPASSKRH
jgi:hypothetical protein